MVCAAHAALVSLTFWPHTRLLLPVQPIAVTAATGALFALSRRAPWIAAAACVALSLGVATSIAPTLRTHRDAVPVEEIEAAMEVARRDGPLTTIASFHGSMARFVPAQFVYVPQMPYGRHEPAAYLARVADSLAQSPADYLILGPKTCGGASTAALREAAPADAEVVHQDDAVLVLRLQRPSMDWAERATAVVADGMLELAIDVRPDAGVLLAGFTARPAAGDALLIPLGRVGEHSYRSTMRAPADVERWSFVPSCVLTDGRKLLAPAVAVTR